MVATGSKGERCGARLRPPRQLLGHLSRSAPQPALRPSLRIDGWRTTRAIALPEFHASDPLPVLLPPVDGPSPALRRAGPSDSESGASQLASPCSSCCRRRPREAANPHPPFTHPYLSAAKAGGPGIGPKAFDRDREEEGRAREGLSDRKGGRGEGRKGGREREREREGWTAFVCVCVCV